MRARGFAEPVEWTLALDELEETGLALRPRMPVLRERGFTGPQLGAARGSEPLSKILKAVKLDPLTIVDDKKYIPFMNGQRNLPDFVKEGLAAFY
jgi:hypothetical protein